MTRIDRSKSLRLSGLSSSSRLSSPSISSTAAILRTSGKREVSPCGAGSYWARDSLILLRRIIPAISATTNPRIALIVRARFARAGGSRSGATLLQSELTNAELELGSAGGGLRWAGCQSVLGGVGCEEVGEQSFAVWVGCSHPERGALELKRMTLERGEGGLGEESAFSSPPMYAGCTTETSSTS